MNLMKNRLFSNQLIYSLRNRFAKIHDNPIIVLGNQKSGTSVIAHLLADFGGLSKTIDIPPLWASVHGIEIMRGRIDFTDIVIRHRIYFSTELIKEPMMIFFANQVLEMFPRAKYAFVIRGPRDNIRSILNSRNVPGHLREMEERFIPGPPRNRMIVNAFIDASVWGGETENYIGVLAHRWNKAVDIYLRHQDRMILARYEDFMNDKCGFIIKIAEELGIPKKNDISQKVNIQYQPRGKERNVSWEEFFGRENLMCIERICGSRMRKFGYFCSHERIDEKKESKNDDSRNT